MVNAIFISVCILSPLFVGYLEASTIHEQSGLVGVATMVLGLVAVVLVAIIGVSISFFTRHKVYAKKVAPLAYFVPALISWIVIFLSVHSS